VIDMFKSRQITAMFTSLTRGDSEPELSEIGVSSQMDVWLLLRNLECNGERNRGLFVLKARGIAHSNQIREFALTDQGVQLLDVYIGTAGLLTGSARVAQEARERMEDEERKQQLQRKTAELTAKRRKLEQQMARMKADFVVEEQGVLRDLDEMKSREKQNVLARVEIQKSRGSGTLAAHGNGIH